jgi:ABC-type uncharacterized transport system fused permease/ATPase subunit
VAYQCRGLTFYRASALDTRVRNIDQLMTSDVQLFCTKLASLYSNTAKPLLDIALFSSKLAEVQHATLYCRIHGRG